MLEMIILGFDLGNGIHYNYYTQYSIMARCVLLYIVVYNKGG